MTTPAFIQDDDGDGRLPLRPAGTRTEAHNETAFTRHLEHQVFYGPLKKLADQLYDSGPLNGPEDALNRLKLVQQLHSNLDAVTSVLLADSLEQVSVAFAGLLATEDASTEAARAAANSAAHYGVDRSSEEAISSNFVAEAALALRETTGKVGKRMFHAKGLRHLCQETLTALAAGQITLKAAHDIVKYSQDLSPEQIARMERQLLPVAKTASDDAVYQRARRFHDRMNPEAAKERREQSEASRKVSWWPTQNGMGCLKYEGRMDIIESIGTTLRWYAGQHDAPTDTRTKDQLMADIYADALINGWPGHEGTPLKPRVAITIPAVELLADPSKTMAELEGHGPIPLGVAMELAKDAPSFQRVLTDPWTGAVIDVEPKRYRPSQGLRDFLRYRDVQCCFPGCRRSADTSEIDHIQDFAQGGHTTRENTHLLCKRHQMFKHALGWKVVARPDGTKSWISPHRLSTVVVPGSVERVEGLDHVHDHCPKRPRLDLGPRVHLTSEVRRVLSLPVAFEDADAREVPDAPDDPGDAAS